MERNKTRTEITGMRWNGIEAGCGGVGGGHEDGRRSQERDGDVEWIMWRDGDWERGEVGDESWEEEVGMAWDHGTGETGTNRLKKWSGEHAGLETLTSLDCIIGENEYCQWETFNATCTGANEMISITSARYGRMRTGRCLLDNYMIGCVANVSDLVKRRCDGKTSCAISLPDQDLHLLSTCRRGLVSYLEVDYSCVPGKTGSLYIVSPAETIILTW